MLSDRTISSLKGKTWTPITLKEVGGTEGVGVTFLEETFSASTAPPEHRYHQKAARAVLKALLPESGTDIKGTMRSHTELLDASGYANRPREFDDLIRILDSEIRLITPTDPEGVQTRGRRAGGRQPSEFRRPLLPTHARLSGAVAARLADPQTDRNPARMGRTLIPVDRQAAKPASAVAVGMGQHSHADGQKVV